MTHHPTEQCPALFSNIGNVSIYGGNYHQQNSQNSVISNEPGLNLLLQKASPAAIHDSSDRDPPPRCAESTRKNALMRILNWIYDASPAKNIFWLNGPFGNGKSAIMQTVAETLRADPQKSHLLAGSFFFGRGKPGRDKAEYLVPTLAYQIATNISWMRKHIDMALSRDPTILSKSIEAQLRYLITEPLRDALDSSSSPCAEPSPPRPFHTPTVVIDGLDECQGRDFQSLVLKAIGTALAKDNIQLRFLIASRPERNIAEILQSQLLVHHRHLSLVDDRETDKELFQYFRSGFDMIYERYFDLFSSINTPWPSDQELRELVRKTSGQFLYASTVLKFVDSDDSHPMDRLKLILTKQSRNAAAFSNMDDLYSQILESCPCQEYLPSFLRSLLVLRELEQDPFLSQSSTLANLVVVSGLPAHSVSIMLRRLPAILNATWPKQSDQIDGYFFQKFLQYYSPAIRVHHESFAEFLVDKERSGRFFVDMNLGRQDMCTRLDNLIAHCLSMRESPCGTIHQYTWWLVSHQLNRDANAESFGWPRLRMTLDSFNESWDDFTSKPCAEFFSALLSVISGLTWSHGIPWNSPSSASHKAQIKKYMDVCIKISDAAYLKFLPSTPIIWTIAAHVSVQHLILDSGAVGVRKEVDVVKLSQHTGLSVETLFKISEENSHFLDVQAIYGRLGRPHFECNIILREGLQSFILRGSLSGDLYLSYRHHVLLEFNAQLMHNAKVLKSLRLLDSIFNHSFIFGRHDLSIKINTDMQESSPMRAFIDILHFSIQQHGDSAKSLCSHSDRSFLWLCQQFQIVKTVLEYKTTARQLQEIIEIVKDNAITACFSQVYVVSGGLDKFPPYGVAVLRFWASHHQFLDFKMELYSNTSFFWDEKEANNISALDSRSHTAIIGFYIHILLSTMFSRELSDEERKSLYSKLDNVLAEYHFLRASASKRIRTHLLTIHYLLTKRHDLIQRSDLSVVIGELPLPFLRGSLTWYRKYYKAEGGVQNEDDDEQEIPQHLTLNDYRSSLDEDYPSQGDSFETWCEKVIASKEQ